MSEITCLVDGRFRLSESPVWDDVRGRLLWVDIPAGAVHCLDLASHEERNWHFDGPVGSLGLARSGRLVIAVGGSVHLFDVETGGNTRLAEVEPNWPEARLNDGKVGPDGAFWVGSMDDREVKEPIAGLYRVTADGRVERRIEGLTVSNGLAWSADGRTMFHSDSRGPWIDRWTFDPASGAIADRRRVRTLTNEDGRPDGGATDVDGTYWSCGVSAGRLNGFTADGVLKASIATPVPAPTMPCFGGQDMRTLFFTSLRTGLGEDRLAQYPQSGGIFMMRMPTPGVPVARFAD